MKTVKTQPQPLLHRILESVSNCLDAASARKLAALRLDARAQALLDEFADKSTEGTLTAEEQAEYRAIVSLLNYISILQSQARRQLKKQRQATAS